MQVGRTHFQQLHAQLPAQHARQGYFQLGVREKEQTLARQALTVTLQGLGGACAWLAGGVIKTLGRHLPFISNGLQPQGCAFLTERKRCADALRAALFKGNGGIAKKRLGQNVAGIGTDRRNAARTARRQEAHRADAHLLKQAQNWSSTTSARAPTTSRDSRARLLQPGISGTSDARQASSPWVKVVSMPLPE